MGPFPNKLLSRSVRETRHYLSREFVNSRPVQASLAFPAAAEQTRRLLGPRGGMLVKMPWLLLIRMCPWRRELITRLGEHTAWRRSKAAKGDGQTLNGFIDISELLIAASNVAASTVWRQAASYGEIPGMSLRNTPGI